MIDAPTDYPINDAGIDLLKSFEQFAKTMPDNPQLARAYWDELGKVWTLGWGFTKGVVQGDRMTLTEANHRLAVELSTEYVSVILSVCTVSPNENELSAMACLAWNIGIGWDASGPKPKGAKDGFRQSSVLRAHNRGDRDAAARAFALWNQSGGQVVAGLTRRRASESALYLKPVSGADIPTPQVVDGESKLSSSPIITGTSITATASAAALVAQSFKDVRDSLGDALPFVAVVVIVVVAGYVIYQRYKQRKGGWA